MSSLDGKIDLAQCTSSARMGHFGLQVKRQSEPMLIETLFLIGHAHASIAHDLAP